MRVRPTPERRSIQRNFIVVDTSSPFLVQKVQQLHMQQLLHWMILGSSRSNMEAEILHWPTNFLDTSPINRK